MDYRCPHCASPVAIDDDACPNCGLRMPVERGDSGCGIAVFCLALFVFGMMILAGWMLLMF